MTAVSSDKDTRERPKKSSYKALTRFPKTRTKTGCFTCRKRKKKCDEKSPVCQGCSRNFLKCVWPSYATETLPKDFQISSCTDDDFDNKISTVSSYKAELGTKITMKETVTAADRHDESFYEDELPNIPSSLCSVMEVRSYKHKIPYPESTIIPESIDFVVESISGINKNSRHTTPSASSEESDSTSTNSQLLPSLDDIYIDHHAISQMFNSLYSKPGDKSVPINSPDSEESFYDDLLNYNPKTSVPTVSIKNPVIAAFREIFFARGCSYLAKNNSNESQEISDKYTAAANKHYSNSVMMISEYVTPYKAKGTPDNGIENWMVFSMKTLCMADRLLGLISENCISNLISVECNMSSADANSTLSGLKECPTSKLGQVLFSEVLFIYPFLIYFSKFDSLLEILPPVKMFHNYNNEMVEIFLDNADPSTQNGANGEALDVTGSSGWLRNVLNTAMINVLQNLTKMMWLLRMRNSLELEQLNTSLKHLKTDISLIWTTIQTAEIQLDKEDPFVDFAKLSHMSSEILFLAISDTPVNASSPIIGFYLDQFMASYESYLKNSDGHPDTIAKCFFILPLFIAACAAQTLYQKEFISKELYILSRELGHEFVEQLTLSIEDAWCAEQKGEATTFSKLVSREGFSRLARVN